MNKKFSLTTSNPKAAKYHECEICKEIINIGDKYFYSKGIVDGKPEAHKECVLCHRVRRTLISRMPNGQVIWFDELIDVLEQLAFYGYQKDLYSRFSNKRLFR